MCNSKHQGSVN